MKAAEEKADTQPNMAAIVRTIFFRA